jgi:threonine 3-dehydrogenase
MKALVKSKGEVGLWMEDRPLPQCGPLDVLVKINKTAICGTDIHIYNWDKWSQENVPVGLITGHEFAGEVVEIGEFVKQVKVGARVSAEGHVTCGVCRNCRAGNQHLCNETQGIGVQINGAFAEYVVVPATNIYQLPDGVSDEMGSILDPFGNAVHTALSFPVVGEDVLITGAGPVGVMAAAVARFAGAKNVVITDVNDHRLELASKLGATRAVNVAKTDLKAVMQDLKIVEGFDVAMEMSGNPAAFTQIIDTANFGAKIACLGVYADDLTVDWNKVIFKSLVLKGVYGREMFDTWYKMTSMLLSGLNIDAVITDHFKVDDFQTGFDKMLSGKSGKVILDWT